MIKKPWTDAECEFLRDSYARLSTADCATALGRTYSSVAWQARNLGLRKSKEWISARARERSLDRVHRGKMHRFPKGSIPWNKGKSYPATGRAVETQFKAGRPANEARNYRPIGSHRVTKEGYVQRKITDDQSIAPVRRWVGVHLLVWEAEHGPVPAGHFVAFKPGAETTNPAEITLDRLELLSRAESMARNSVHNYPAPVKHAMKLLKKAERALEKRCE